MPIVKIGRTHLQDATPIRLGQEFQGYAGQIERGDPAAATTPARELERGRARRHGRRHRHQHPPRVRRSGSAPC